MKTAEGLAPDDLEGVLESREAQSGYIVNVDDKSKFSHAQVVGGITMVPQNGPKKYLGISIFGLPYYLGQFQRYEKESDPRVNDVMFLDNPDFVVRKDAPRGKLIPALDKACGSNSR